MCGRFTLRTPASEWIQQFLLDVAPVITPRYNIAPTQNVAAVRHRAGEAKPEFAWLHWGLVPSWAESPAMGNRLLNARLETIAEKPSFRSAFKKRRCLIVADGYYEWQTQGKQKQPFHIHRADGRAFAIAGLWEQWQERAGEPPLESCTLMTREAHDSVRAIHDRMPVIITPDDYAAWLDPALTSADELSPLLSPHDCELVCTPVSTHVNNARHEDAACLTPPTGSA